MGAVRWSCGHHHLEHGSGSDESLGYQVASEANQADAAARPTGPLGPERHGDWSRINWAVTGA